MDRSQPCRRVIHASPRLIAIVVVLAGALASPAVARAQSAADAFNPGANGAVSAVAIQADGKVLLGGAFTNVAAVTRNRLARLNADGTIDLSFNPGATDTVRGLLVQPDGKIIVFGDFNGLGGGTGTTPRDFLGRLNADGSVDPSFNPTPNLGVQAVVLQPDGKIVIGGFFTTLGPAPTTPRSRIARLNPNGSIDTSFDPGANASVLSMALQADGKILVGGFFTGLGGGTGTTPRASIGRINANGSLDAGFNPGANDAPLAFAVQPDAKIVVAGQFETLGGNGTTPRNEIGRLNPDGSVDAAFNPGANNHVDAVAIQPDGKILVGGAFTGLGGGTGTTPRNRVGRLNGDGSVDTSFNPGANSSVFALVVQPDGRILVGGLFTGLGGGTGVTLRNRVGRLYADGSVETAFDPGANNTVLVLAPAANGDVLVGGFFTMLGGGGTGTVVRNRIGRLHADGSLDASFNPGANTGTVNAIAVQPNGQVLVGGSFTGLGGGNGATPRNRIGRINADGTVDPSFNPNANGEVFAIAIQADGKILVGGPFTTIGGATRNRIARLNPDGSLDLSFDPGANNQVLSMAVQPDGKIVVGGTFTALGGGTGTTARAFIGRLNADGSLDPSFDPGANSQPLTVLVQADGKILVGGAFTKLGGGGGGVTTRNRIGRLNADGSIDGSFDPGATNIVRSLALQCDGAILVGGSFTGLGGGTGNTARNFLGRLNPDGSVDGFNPGANSNVNGLAIQASGKILVGGAFTMLGGGGTGITPRASIGQLTNTSGASQTLALAPGNLITWIRGGTAPDVSRATFESSLDGTTYSPLGDGTRIGGGWQFAGASLPVNQPFYLRARGYYSTGSLNGSYSVVESTLKTFILPPPTMTLSSTKVNFGAVNNGIGTLTVQTPAQSLLLTQSGFGSVIWTTSASQPWILVSPPSGSGGGTISISIANTGGVLPVSGLVTGTVTINTVGAANSPSATINLTVLQGTNTAPLGVFETPADGTGGLAGSIAVTGWAVDEIGVAAVRICRDGINGEFTPIQPLCGNQPKVYVGDATLVPGARPDVAAAFPLAPYYDRAGWGYLLLTNFLPNQGNGTFTLAAFAEDYDGFVTPLGQKTMTCTNASSILPFGAIDTPGQGGLASGGAFVNFGWALAGQPTGRFIPTDGSTITVFIDSMPIGTVDSYNNARPDIQALFPGYVNTNGAVGFKTLDTLGLSNGVHTIAWLVFDNLGAAAGIGSRFFTVSNSSVFADAQTAASLSEIDADPGVAVAVRRGYAPGTRPQRVEPDADGVRHVRASSLERIVIDLDPAADTPGTFTGYAIDGGVPRALPIGSHLDPATGEFAWAPPLAFAGAHDLLFVKSPAGADASSGARQIRVRVTIDPRPAAPRDGQMVIDRPAAGATLVQPFTVAGWAIEPGGPAGGPGIDTLHVWAYPAAGGDPQWVGVAGYGGVRPDVADLMGARFGRSGYTIEVAGLAPGAYDIVVYAHSLASGDFTIARVVRVTVE